MSLNPVALAALISALIQLVSHWFPWRMVLKQDLPRIPSYVIGVLGFLLPVSGLYWHWEQSAVVAAGQYLAGLWACVASSGLAVVVAYAIDYVTNRVRMASELQELDDVRKE